jgi:glycerophosphoryl diester phosphodiesterase
LVGAVPRDWPRQLQTLDCMALHADQRRLDAATVASVRHTDVPLFAYTVNLAERATELFSWGVNSVFSDCPERVSAGLAGRSI